MMAICKNILYRAIIFQSMFNFLNTGVASAEEYKLGPQDRLQIKVFDLRAGSGEAHQWPAFDGEFIVDQSGKISLPLLGELRVGGSTVEQVSKEIASGVQSKVGLAQLPTAATQVIKYRPFYIYGMVEKPGEYEYRPGLTVLQAISLAGGFYRAVELSRYGADREIVSQAGDLGVLTKELRALQVKEVRLDSEANEAKTISFPQKATQNDPDRARLEEIESRVFYTNVETLKAKLKTIDETRTSLSSELEALAKKDATVERQIDLSQKDLAQVRDLTSRGLTVSTRQLASEQSLAAYENTRLDIQLAKLRAQQELGKLSRDVVELKSKSKQEALIALNETRKQISTVAEKINTGKLLLKNSERARQMVDYYATNRKFVLSRRDGANTKETEVKNEEAVEPGDVIDVQVIPDSRLINAASNDPVPSKDNR